VTRSLPNHAAFSEYVTLGENPGELIAAIPALLSFAPADSIVLTGLASESAPQKVKVVARSDLPAPNDVSDVLELLLAHVRNGGLDVVALLIVGGGTTDSADLPHRDLVDEISWMFQEMGVVVGHAVWAERIDRGLMWRSYTDSTSSGPIADPARFVVGDTVIYASRAEFAAAQLAPDSKPALRRRTLLLRALPPVHPDDDLAVLQATIDRIVTDTAVPLTLDDDTIVRLGYALTHPHVREAAWSFALTERAYAAERLWNRLTRAVPRPIVVNPACLLAVSAYLRGDPLASVAVETALTSNPDHLLTTTVRKLMYSGLSPEAFRQLLTDTSHTHTTNRLGVSISRHEGF
jgi:hypothetical protein